MTPPRKRKYSKMSTTVEKKVQNDPNKTLGYLQLKCSAVVEKQVRESKGFFSGKIEKTETSFERYETTEEILARANETINGWRQKGHHVRVINIESETTDGGLTIFYEIQ